MSDPLKDLATVTQAAAQAAAKAASAINEELGRVRARIKEKDRELSAVSSAPLPLEDALDVVRAAIDKQAAPFEHRAYWFIEPYGGAAQKQILPDRYELKWALAWILRDQIVAAYEREISKVLQERPPGLPREQRLARESALNAEIAELRAREAAIIRQARAAGLNIG